MIMLLSELDMTGALAYGSKRALDALLGNQGIPCLTNKLLVVLVLESGPPKYL